MDNGTLHKAPMTHYASPGTIAEHKSVLSANGKAKLDAHPDSLWSEEWCSNWKKAGCSVGTCLISPKSDGATARSSAGGLEDYGKFGVLWRTQKATRDATSNVDTQPGMEDVTSKASTESATGDVTSDAATEAVVGCITGERNTKPGTGDLISTSIIAPEAGSVTDDASTKPGVGDMTGDTGIKPGTEEATSGAGWGPEAEDVTDDVCMEPRPRDATVNAKSESGRRNVELATRDMSSDAKLEPGVRVITDKADSESRTGGSTGDANRDVTDRDNAGVRNLKQKMQTAM